MTLDNFRQGPNEESFAELFNTFTRQLLAFFRARRCQWDDAEDLAQEVMLKVYLKIPQLRDPKAFRAWLFTMAGNALSDHYGKQTREIQTVALEDFDQKLMHSAPGFAAIPAFEFLHWMALLDPGDSEIMKLRFLENWEYHEIAAAKNLPIGTVQWKVFDAKKKLARHLTTRRERLPKAT